MLSTNKSRQATNKPLSKEETEMILGKLTQETKNKMTGCQNKYIW